MTPKAAVINEQEREPTTDWTVERKTAAFVDFIGELEERFPVDQWVMDSVHIWPIIRLHLCFSFFDSQFFERTPRAGTIGPGDAARIVVKICRSAWDFAVANAVDFRKSIHGQRQFDLLFLNYNTYMTSVNGLWYARVCEPFVENLAKRGMSSLILTGGYKYSVPRVTRSMFIQPYLTMYRALGMLKRNLETAAGLTDLETYVRKSPLFSESFSLTKPVVRHLKQIRGIEQYFKRILEKTRPKAVFVTCCYSTESMACILACREMGIPSVDIQHGSQGDVHIAYGKWNRLPEKGYELLPTIFWCWHEIDASTIRKWSANLTVHQPVVGGNLFLERWVAGDDDIVRVYDIRLNDLKRPFKEKIHILYTLNGCTRNELRAMVEVIEAINRGGVDAHFWVRLHPVTIEQQPIVRRVLEQNGIENFDLDNATSLPLYAILRHIDIHITEFSSVVIEAESFHVPSVIGELGAASFPSQVSSGWAVVAHSIDDIVAAIQTQMAARSKRIEESRHATVHADRAFDRLFEMLSRLPPLAPSQRADRRDPQSTIAESGRVG